MRSTIESAGGTFTDEIHNVSGHPGPPDGSASTGTFVDTLMTLMDGCKNFRLQCLRNYNATMMVYEVLMSRQAGTTGKVWLESQGNRSGMSRPAIVNVVSHFGESGIRGSSLGNALEHRVTSKAGGEGTKVARMWSCRSVDDEVSGSGARDKVSVITSDLPGECTAVAG